MNYKPSMLKKWAASLLAGVFTIFAFSACGDTASAFSQLPENTSSQVQSSVDSDSSVSDNKETESTVSNYGYDDYENAPVYDFKIESHLDAVPIPYTVPATQMSKDEIWALFIRAQRQVEILENWIVCQLQESHIDKEIDTSIPCIYKRDGDFGLYMKYVPLKAYRTKQELIDRYLCFYTEEYKLPIIEEYFRDKSPNGTDVFPGMLEENGRLYNRYGGTVGWSESYPVEESMKIVAKEDSRIELDVVLVGLRDYECRFVLVVENGNWVFAHGYRGL